MKKTMSFAARMTGRAIIMTVLVAATMTASYGQEIERKKFSELPERHAINDSITLIGQTDSLGNHKNYRFPISAILDYFRDSIESGGTVTVVTASVTPTSVYSMTVTNETTTPHIKLDMVPASGYTVLGNNSASSAVPSHTKVFLNTMVQNTLPVANGGTGVINIPAHNIPIGVGTSPIVFFAPGAAGTIVRSDGTDFQSSTATYPNTAGTAGKVMISDGTNFVSSTPTYPNASVTAGKVIISDGTNYVASTPTYPNASATAGKVMISDGTNYVASTPTYPNASATAGKILISDGTNYVASTPTYPNASATSRKILVSDGTNFVASTETYATPGTSGNVMKSDGTNWTSAAPDVTATNTITFTNKRWTARVSSNTTVSATPSVNTDNYDVVKFTAQTATITSMTTNLSGTPNDGDIICFELTAGSGTPGITWGASFVNSTVTAPTALSTTTVTVFFRYSTTSSYGTNKWICAKTF